MKTENLMDVNERELIKRAKGGDRKAFDKLIMEYKDKMFGLTYRMTGDREAALDLTQDTFLAAFKDLRRFRQQSAFSSWLYRIAANKSINCDLKNIQQAIKYLVQSSSDFNIISKSGSL